MNKYLIYVCVKNLTWIKLIYNNILRVSVYTKHFVGYKTITKLFLSLITFYLLFFDIFIGLC